MSDDPVVNEGSLRIAQEKIQRLEAEVDALKAEVESTWAEVASLEAEITRLQSRKMAEAIADKANYWLANASASGGDMDACIAAVHAILEKGDA